MFKTSLKIAFLAAALLAPGAAFAAASAVVTTDLNIRTGPGPGYQRFDTIPAGDHVAVYGCISGYNWCDIVWRGEHGWVSGDYLAYLGDRYNRRPISSVGIAIGLPIIAFEPYEYHRRYYVGRPWYRDRYRDRDGWRERREDRREWREHRRDWDDDDDWGERRREVRRERSDNGEWRRIVDEDDREWAKYRREAQREWRKDHEEAIREQNKDRREAFREREKDRREWQKERRKNDD